ncbi:unnamed protein product [Amoebophrya sp. A25]|nr:unnamed protein product [Amoebophrya sp. A25]|eukprot:GSA25T00006537001.1
MRTALLAVLYTTAKLPGAVGFLTCAEGDAASYFRPGPRSEDLKDDTSHEVNVVLPGENEAAAMIKESYFDHTDMHGNTTEREELKKLGGNPIYGEIEEASALRLLTSAGLLNATTTDTFYDIGSGLGKFINLAALASPVKKAVGVEYVWSRIKPGLTAKERLNLSFRKHLKEVVTTNSTSASNVTIVMPAGTLEVPKSMVVQNLPDKVNAPSVGEKIDPSPLDCVMRDRTEFKQGDFRSMDWSDLTIGFISAACFSDELVGDICKKMRLESKELRHFALSGYHQLTGPRGYLQCACWLEEYTSTKLNMTWATASEVKLFSRKAGLVDEKACEKQDPQENEEQGGSTVGSSKKDDAELVTL